MGLDPGSRPIETEKGFLAAVVDVARLYHWRVYHPYLSVRSAAGFPDLVLVKAGEPVIYAELKRDDGRLTAAQAAWLEALRQARGTEVYCWRPADFSAIVARLQRRRR